MAIMSGKVRFSGREYAHPEYQRGDLENVHLFCVVSLLFLGRIRRSTGEAVTERLSDDKGYANEGHG